MATQKFPLASMTVGVMLFGVLSCSNNTPSEASTASSVASSTDAQSRATTDAAMTNTNTATATDSNSDNSTKANAQTSSAQDTAQKPAFTTKAIATFDEPWAMTALPTDTDPAPRLLVTEKSGNLFVVDTATGVKHRVAGVPKVAYGGQGGLGDVTLAPDFATTNAIYLSYVEKDANDDKYGAVVIKTTLSDLDTTSPKLTKIRRIWQQVPKISGQGHYSHRLLFSPDGQYLYISSGERQKKTPAQDMNANLGKIVRLNPDGSIPADNPFVKAASNAQANADSANKNKSTTPQSISAQIWTLGHRNVLGMQFDDAGRLWAHEMGPRGGDEFNLIEKGNNYGWPVVSNGRNYSGIDIPDHSTRPDFTAPQTSWTPVISPASMSFYQAGAQKDFPAWQNNMLISGLSSKSLVVVSIPTDENARDAQAKERYRYDMGERIRSVLSVDGMVWVLEDGSDGRLLRLLPE